MWKYELKQCSKVEDVTLLEGVMLIEGTRPFIKR